MCRIMYMCAVLVCGLVWQCNKYLTTSRVMRVACCVYKDYSYEVVSYIITYPGRRGPGRVRLRR